MRLSAPRAEWHAHGDTAQASSTPGAAVVDASSSMVDAVGLWLLGLHVSRYGGPAPRTLLTDLGTHLQAD